MPERPTLTPESTRPSLDRIVHDLKNLLGVVVGFADVVLTDLPADDKRREDVLEIKRAGQAALALTEDLPEAS